MNKTFILLWMIFNHVLDDYFLQGILASMKQKQWWQEHAPEELYRNDYIMALLMHSISWTFMVMLPVARWMHFSPGILFLYMFVVNVILHMEIDNMKANRKTINLVQDQVLHLLQIVCIFFVLVL